MGKNERLELVYTCKVCTYVEGVPLDEELPEDMEPQQREDILRQRKENMCLFRHDVLYVAKESIRIEPSVIHDPTLARDYDYFCHACGHNEAVFYRLAESIVSDAMAIVFVCVKCTSWRTEGKEVQHETSELGARLQAEREAREAAENGQAAALPIADADGHGRQY